MHEDLWIIGQPPSPECSAVKRETEYDESCHRRWAARFRSRAHERRFSHVPPVHRTCLQKLSVSMVDTLTTKDLPSLPRSLTLCATGGIESAQGRLLAWRTGTVVSKRRLDQRRASRFRRTPSSLSPVLALRNCSATSRPLALVSARRSSSARRSNRPSPSISASPSSAKIA